MKKLTLQLILLPTILLLILFSSGCKKSSPEKIDDRPVEENIGSLEVTVGGNPSSTQVANICGSAYAYLWVNTKDEKMVTIEAKFPSNSSLKIELPWDEINPLQSYNLNTVLGESTHLGNAVYYFDGNRQKSLLSENGGRGVAVLTQYDRESSRLGGKFYFSGRYFDGWHYLDSFEKVVGAFIDIPLLDPRKPDAFPCNSQGQINGTHLESTVSTTLEPNR